MREQSLLINIIKGVCVTLIVTLIGVLVFSFIIKLAVLNGKTIKMVNQFIKIISLFLGCLFSVRGKLGLLRGAIIGVLSMAVIYLVFALLGASNAFNIGFVLDLVFGLIVGAISGLIAVNVHQ
jgi:putative membrane protein (TIGR04086 family)